jgi:hypothetical protein
VTGVVSVAGVVTVEPSSDITAGVFLELLNPIVDE